MTWESGPCLPEPITTVGDLRFALAKVPNGTTTGPCFIEYSPSDRRLDVHPIADPEEDNDVHFRAVPTVRPRCGLSVFYSGRGGRVPSPCYLDPGHPGECAAL